MTTSAIKKMFWIAGVFIVVLGMCACAANQMKTSMPSATPTSVDIASPTPVPGSWQRFTYPISSVFSIEYPYGWTLAPPLANAETFDSGSINSASPDGRPDMVVSVSATLSKGAIASICPTHPTMTVAGLPASRIAGHDTIGQPYYEWNAANEDIGVRFIFTVSLSIGQLDKFQGIYTHMLKSIIVPTQYAHASACVA